MLAVLVVDSIETCLILVVLDHGVHAMNVQ